MTKLRPLGEIIADRDLRELEAYALAMRTYARLIERAKTEGVDLDELEELLAQI